MSQFDDDEEYIIYGPRRRRDYTEELSCEDVHGWQTEAGQYVTVEGAGTQHLVNALNKFRREGRAAGLCASMNAELDRRAAAGDPLLK